MSERNFGRGGKREIADPSLVQSLNSPFFPPHIGAEPGRAKRRVQDNLHAHARNEPIKNYKAVVDKSPLLLSSTCRVIPFSARALTKKNIFFGVDIVVKNKLIRVYRGLYSYRQRLRVITLFPNLFRIVSGF